MKLPGSGVGDKSGALALGQKMARSLLISIAGTASRLARKDKNTTPVSALPHVKYVLALGSFSNDVSGLNPTPNETFWPLKNMNIAEIIEVVIFCGIVCLSLLAVIDVLFASPSKQRKRTNHWKQHFAQIGARLAKNKPGVRAQRRVRATRHDGGSA